MGKSRDTSAAISAAALPGRDGEWRAILDRCERMRQGEGGVLWFVGEAGIGKTCLQQRLRAWAEERNDTTIWGRHIGHRQAPPLHGMREALSQLFAIEAGDGPDEVDGKIRRRIDERWPALGRHRRALGRFLEPMTDVAAAGAAGAGHGQNLYHLMVRLLTACARQRPLLLFLDDVHWADAVTLDFLKYLSPFLADQTILVVAAQRPGESANPQLLDALRLEPGATVLTLSRLDLWATTAMVQHAGIKADDDFCAKLHQLTEGVPLFIEQWLLSLNDAGHPTERLLSQRPESISQTILRRLQDLSPAARTLVQAAAVIGDRFNSELLQQVDGRPLPEVLDLLADLETRSHILRSDTSEPADYPLAFSHTLLRQVAYDALPQARRQLLHGRAGAALQKQLPRRPQAVFEVSHHYTVARLRPKAAGVLHQAGQWAQGLGSLAEARNYFERALDLSVEDHERAAIRSSLGNVVFFQGDRDAGRKLWLAALKEQHEPLERAVLYRKLGQSWSHSDYARQWRYFHLGLDETRRHPHAAVRGELLAELALVPDPEHGGTPRDQARIAAQAGEALRILRRPDHRSTFAFLLIHLFTNVYIRLGDGRNANIARKSRLLKRGVRLAEALDDWSLAIEGRFKLCLVWLSRDMEKALTVADAALELADDYLAPDHPRIGDMLQRMLRYALAHGDRQRLERYCRRLGLDADDPIPGLAAYQWADHPEAAWLAQWQQAQEVCQKSMVGMSLVTHITRLERLAHHRAWQDRWRAALAQLGQEYPDYFASLPPVLWGLRRVRTDELDEPTGALRTAVDLRWEDPIGNSRCLQHDSDGVEIAPGPDVGLGWLRRAPCLINTVEGDFTFEARIPQQADARRAGGLAVWDDRGRLMRFASGVDHVGQVSLAWNNGDQLRYACAGYLPDEDILLRLVRRGRRYSAFVRAGEGSWHTCGQLNFGDAGAVDVALFAEACHEYDVPQLYPIRFAAVRLWVSEAATAPPPPPVAARQLYPLPAPPAPFCGMVGQHRTFKQFCRQLEEVARSSLPLLIVGESGTGKELAARATHLLSPHRDGPYVPLNVAALPEGIVESELFGHVRGAFTGATRAHGGLFAAAEGGSIFLDEIGELPLEMQARLLRVLDSGEVRALGSAEVRHVDARMIAATNRDLGREVEAGRFRRDLYFRFAEPLVVPPLRQRQDDIPFLVSHFIGLYGQDAEYHITHRAMSVLREHPWADNIRGLRHVMERAVLAADERLIDVEHLVLRSAEGTATAAPPPLPSRGGKGHAPDPVELRRVATACRGNVAAMGRHFGVSRLTVYRWIEGNGLDLQQLRRTSQAS